MDNQYYCSYDELYKKPFGALREKQRASITIKVPLEFGCVKPFMMLRKDSELTPSQVGMDKIKTENGFDFFTVQAVLNEAGLYFYYFDLYKEYRKLYAKENGCAFITTQSGREWQLTVYDEAFETPEWLHGGVMYQIFPDRFYEGAQNKDIVCDGRVYRADKENEPYFWPNEQHEGYLNMDYYGGDFNGIQEKLPYLQSLGVTCIYLNPIFEAHSNHRYNTADYMKPDAMLGTAQDFKALCSKAKALGIHIILDGVFSHTGSDSVYFNREGRYPTLGAYQSDQSPYREWYFFSNDYKIGYRSWWGFETLPEVNEDSASYRNFICGKDGVIDYWLSLGADGFRLDVADELPDSFIQLLRKAVKRNGKDKLLLGEVWEDATNKFSYGTRRDYLLGNGLDSVMNYPFRQAVIDYMHNANAKNAADSIMCICENYPPPALNALMNFLSTHDTVRGITALAGEELANHDRYWQSGRLMSHERYEFGKSLAVLAYAMLFTLPGVPSVYYGDEILMQGYKDPFNRAYFNWQSKEEHLRKAIKELSAIRKNCEAFKSGGIKIHEASGGFMHYERKGESSCAHIIINRTINKELRAVMGSMREIMPYTYLIVTS